MPRRKFQDADFTDHTVSQLDLDFPPDDAGFRCSRREVVTYWRGERIIREVSSSVCQAWYISHESGFAGYITLFADKLQVGYGDQFSLKDRLVRISPFHISPVSKSHSNIFSVLLEIYELNVRV